MVDTDMRQRHTIRIIDHTSAPGEVLWSFGGGGESEGLAVSNQTTIPTVPFCLGSSLDHHISQIPFLAGKAALVERKSSDEAQYIGAGSDTPGHLRFETHST